MTTRLQGSHHRIWSDERDDDPGHHAREQLAAELIEVRSSALALFTPASSISLDAAAHLDVATILIQDAINQLRGAGEGARWGEHTEELLDQSLAEFSYAYFAVRERAKHSGRLSQREELSVTWARSFEEVSQAVVREEVRAHLQRLRGLSTSFGRFMTMSEYLKGREKLASEEWERMRAEQNLASARLTE